MGIIQQQLLALGAVDGGPCSTIPAGAGRIGLCGRIPPRRHSDLPNAGPRLSWMLKDFPAGTQGDTSGLPSTSSET